MWPKRDTNVVETWQNPLFMRVLMCFSYVFSLVTTAHFDGIIQTFPLPPNPPTSPEQNFLSGDAKMDNCNQSTTPKAQADVHSAQPDHGHKISHAQMQEDITAAKLAYEAWKSNDPKDWDHAMAEKTRLLKEDPRAWKSAMKEVDADEKAQKELQAELKAEEAQRAADEAAAKQNTAAEAAAPAVVTMPDEVVTRTPSPAGYAPDSPFAPLPPNSPAYDAAYRQPPAKFYGLNAGLFKIGVTNHGSLDVGVNIGLARAEAQVGLENRIEGEFMPVGGPLHARVGAGVGVNRNGFHGEAGAGANVFNLVGGDADVGARLGRDIGVDADVRGRALLVNGQADGGVSLGDQGLKAHGGGNADILNTLGARGGARVALGPEDTGFGVGVGLKADKDTLDFGPAIDVNGDGKVSGSMYGVGKSENATFFPTGDRTVDEK